MKETGGIRKMRFAVGGRGKSGGVHVVFYFHSDSMPVLLLAILAKNEKDDLSKVKVQEKARKLGIFVGDREFLTCPKCGLMEDVLADGRLVTCHEIGAADSGLRFAAHPGTEDRFVCPQCGTVLRPGKA